VSSTAGNKIREIDEVKLRRRAEKQLGEQSGVSASSPETAEDPSRLRHELQVHQIELEMQNAELRRVRDELETALEQYTDLYDFSPVGYFTLDRNGTITKVNLTGAHLVGADRSRLIGKRFGSLVSGEHRTTFSDFLGKIFTGTAKEACELTLCKEGHAVFWVQIEGVLAPSARECRIALIDLTERKLAQEVHRLEKEAAEALRRAKVTAEALRLEKETAETLRQATELAEGTALAKSQFLVNMSHELRTPMTGILGMLQLTLGEELSPLLRNYLETTLGSARSLLQILNDILDMAKLEAGKLVLEENPLSLRECIAQAVDIITPEVQRKGLSLTISVAEEVPDAVLGDQTRLRQVLINLVSNAVKFTTHGKIEVRVTAGSAVADGKREFTFAVTDTGIGIPETKKALLFQAFSQVDPSLSRKYCGTGLGLAISKDIVELMKGSISFRSTEGVGSVFSFMLPLRETDQERASAHSPDNTAQASASPQQSEQTRRILLAEDDPTIRQVLGGMLQRSNYLLDFAEDGLQAIEMWEQGEYDLMLMDVQMPRLNGFEATCIIRDQEQLRGSHTPIIAMTAHAGKEDESRCLTAGMDAYVSKPIDFVETLRLIREILSKGRLVPDKQ
jgi:PAS domain S-box-containing protein